MGPQYCNEEAQAPTAAFLMAFCVVIDQHGDDMGVVNPSSQSTAST